jgi:uncharacterized sporulation protein YeaH/YhbH (DUF444 family)
MKPYILLSSIFLTLTGSAFAQEQAPKPIRETLFGSTYKEDMQKNASSNVNARKAVNARGTATSSKTLLFTDYRPQTKSAKRMAAAKAAGTPLPSAVSGKEAAAKAPKPVLLKAPVIEQTAPAETKPAALKPAAKKN